MREKFRQKEREQSRILITVPHNVKAKKDPEEEHWYDSKAGEAARIAAKTSGRRARLGDVPRSRLDLNRKESRKTRFRRELSNGGRSPCGGHAFFLQS